MLTEHFKVGEVFSMKGIYFQVEEADGITGRMVIRNISKEKAKEQALAAINQTGSAGPNRAQRRHKSRKGGW